MRIKNFLALAGTLVGAVGIYVRWIRPWTRRWGATDEEVARPMPGDEIVERADYIATRAITIRATPDEVLPWLVQIGSGRAGWSRSRSGSVRSG